MTDFIILVFSGALVGFAIGLTGVGGGSLMTPILLLLGYPAPVAIGTDLLYAAVTKGSGVYFHQRKKNINWRVMALLAAGSIPLSIAISLFVIDDELRSSEDYESVMTVFLGIMLILTSLVITFQKQIQRRLLPGQLFDQSSGTSRQDKATLTMTVVLGILLGVCVTFTSVGAGAIGAAILFLFYPGWKARSVVGTDIAHAVPLTLVAGLGYLFNDLVDLTLLFSLLAGSLPGIYLGTHVGSLFPDKVMRGILISALLLLGLYFTLLHQ